MSALCGIVYLDGRPAAAGDLEAPMAVMAHHTVDGVGVWAAGPAALGHQMLWVTPESQHEQLPYHDSEAGLTITADVRLDNREELFAALRVPYADRKEMSDSRLILLAYLKWGEETPIHLLGDFAFAIWDARSRRLFCARDILGAMPFFYHQAAGRFAFASEIRAMLALDDVPPVLDMSTLAGYLDRRPAVHLTRSFYRDVPKLPPAHALTVDSDGLHQSPYWYPEDARDVRYRSDEGYVEELQALLQEAVACRLRSDYPIGAHISGGLDSSTVAVLAARELRSRQRRLVGGYSWSPPLREAEEYLPGDERVRVEAVSKQEGIPIQYADLTPKDGVEPLLRDISTQPTETLTRELVVVRSAEQAGIRVLLSGWGGDELISFNARGYYADMFWRGHWRTLRRELEIGNRSLWRTLTRHVILPGVPEAIVRVLRPKRVDGSQLSPEALSPYVAPAILRQLRVAGVGAVSCPLGHSSIRETQLALLRQGHLTWRLESWAYEGARHRLVYRYPLLDRRIIEFALGLPPMMYLRNGQRRYLFRRASLGMLPAAIRQDDAKEDLGFSMQAERLRPRLIPLLLEELAVLSQVSRTCEFVDFKSILSDLESLLEADESVYPANLALFTAMTLAVLNPAIIVDCADKR